MAFRFSLQSVLRLRRSLENQEEQRLMAIAAESARVRSEIQKLEEAAQLQSELQFEEMQPGAAIGVMLQFQAECQERRIKLKGEWTKKLAELERKRQEQAGAYRNARQKREILEGLRDHKREEWKMEIAQREQQRMD